MDQVKGWLSSKTVWMSILGVLMQVAVVFKVPLPADLDTNLLATHLANVVTGVLFVAAAVFRVRAKHKLK